MKQKRKILSLLLCIIMVFSLTTHIFSAEQQPIVYQELKTVKDLEDAIKNGGDYKLANDITLNKKSDTPDANSTFLTSFTLEKNVTIDLNGHSIYGNTQDTVFKVPSGITMTINDSTATHKEGLKSGKAGTVKNSNGSYTVTYAVYDEKDNLTYNTYTAGAIIGGIKNHNIGGAIRAINIDSGTVNFNEGIITGTGVYIKEAAPSAIGILMAGSAQLNMNGGAISDNWAKTDNKEKGSTAGIGVQLNNDTCNMNVTKGIFANNIADGGYNSQGAAINNSTGGTLNISNAIFSGNKSISDKRAFNGAINSDKGSANLENCIFVNNTASVNAEEGYGGAVTVTDGTIKNCLFSHNSAQSAGAIEIMKSEGKKVVLENVLIQNNSSGLVYREEDNIDIQGATIINNEDYDVVHIYGENNDEFSVYKGFRFVSDGAICVGEEKLGETVVPVLKKDGFAFSGWYDNKDFTGNAITEPKDKKIYYAKWEKAVATINGIGYSDLQTAIKSAKEGDTIVLEEGINTINISEVLEIKGKKDIIIDFNGVTLSNNSTTDKSLIKITNSTGIKIKNANFDLSNNVDVAILVEGKSTLLLDEEITSKKDGSDKAPVISLVGGDAEATLTQGSTINGKTTPDSELIITDENSKNNFTNKNNTNNDAGNYIPSKPSKPTYEHTSIIGSDRYDTAAKIADKLGSYDTAVLVNATSTMSDGLAASGLAGKEDATILLTKKDSIPKVTMDKLKKVKKVYIIGGENAISEKVSAEITKNVPNVKVERLGGKTRVETSELVAKKIGNYSNAFVVNGFKGEADAMSASSIAARYSSPILLTNGKTSAHNKKTNVNYYVVGGASVVNNEIVKKYNAKRLAGDDRYETNREVIDEFYLGSDKLYIANGETLVDALTASTIAKNHGIVLVNKKSDNSVLKDKNTVQVGGMNFEIDFE